MPEQKRFRILRGGPGEIGNFHANYFYSGDNYKGQDLIP